MLFLNKLLPVFFLPLGVVGWLLLLAFWKQWRWPVAVAVVLLSVSSMPWVGQKLLGWVETRYPAVAIDAVEPADAIIVLGGIFGPPMPEGYLANWAESVERFEAGVRLIQAEKAPLMVLSGAPLSTTLRVSTEGAELRREAIARGIPEEKILVTSHVGNTADEARVIAEMMKERNWQRVVLVTTGWHMRRSAYQFERAGVTFTPFPVDFRMDPKRAFNPMDFLPRGEGLMNTETALRECYGYWFYRLFR
jgi:uncharacterized SAM-binding protein YcdF (DUF218 family)